jgi:preprotein translocase subunit SecE
LHNFSIGKIILSISAVVSLVLIIKNYVKIKTFIIEVKTELTKVSWSNRQELTGSTVVIIALTSLMALFIGVIDLLLSQVLSVTFR